MFDHRAESRSHRRVPNRSRPGKARLPIRSQIPQVVLSGKIHCTSFDTLLTATWTSVLDRDGHFCAMHIAVCRRSSSKS